MLKRVSGEYLRKLNQSINTDTEMRNMATDLIECRSYCGQADISLQSMSKHNTELQKELEKAKEDARAAYLKALDDVAALFSKKDVHDQEIRLMLIGMKADYEKNGRATTEYFDQLKSAYKEGGEK